MTLIYSEERREDLKEKAIFDDKVRGSTEDTRMVRFHDMYT